MEQNGQLPFLDILILRSSVYRKLTTNDRYLDFNSNTPIAHKINTAKIPCALKAQEKKELERVTEELISATQKKNVV